MWVIKKCGSSGNCVGEPSFRFSIPAFLCQEGAGGDRSITLPRKAKFSYGHQDAYKSKILPHLNPPLTTGRMRWTSFSQTI